MNNCKPIFAHPVCVEFGDDDSLEDNSWTWSISPCQLCNNNNNDMLTIVTFIDYMWSHFIVPTLFINPVLQNEGTELLVIMQLSQAHMASKWIIKVCALNLCYTALSQKEGRLWRFSFMHVFETRLLTVDLAGYYEQNLLGLLFPKQKWWQPKVQWHQQKNLFLKFVIWNLVFISYYIL